MKIFQIYMFIYESNIIYIWIVYCNIVLHCGNWILFSFFEEGWYFWIQTADCWMGMQNLVYLLVGLLHLFWHTWLVDFIHKIWGSPSLTVISSIPPSFSTVFASKLCSPAKSSTVSKFTQAIPFFQVLTPFYKISLSLSILQTLDGCFLYLFPHLEFIVVYL